MSLRTRIFLPLLAVSAVTLATPLQAEEVIATVNGAKITKMDYQRFVFEATQGKGGKINPNDVLAELLSRELIYQDAIKQGMDKRKDIVAEFERLKHKLLVGAALDEALKKRQVSDKELQAIYDKDIKTLKLTEYKARHILVKEKTQAEQIITELDLGGDFAKLAEKHSTDAGSNKKGGELGWFKPQAMTPAFANAAAELEKGKYSKAPIQTPYGWHIIKLEDSRQATPPTFDQVKTKLAQVVQQQKVAEYVKELKDKADIKINEKK